MNAIVFTGGGTAGHYAPNFAVIPKIQDEFDEIYYFGSENGPERQAALNFGLKYVGVPCAKLERKLTFKNLSILFTLAKGIKAARINLEKIKPAAVFSKGGFAALPTVVAADRLGIPVILHESDLTMGLANKISKKHASLILTAFDITAKNIKGAVCVGTPIREELFLKRDKQAILQKYSLDKNKKTLLVTGGSQGSASINKMVEKCADKLIKRYNIIHVCGRGKKVKSKFKNYVTLEFCFDMGELYSACDMAVSRAGANTLFELISLCKPTLAIPLPKGNSRGDQIENAKYFADKRLIATLFEEQLTEETFLKAIEKLEDNSAELTANCKKANYRSASDKIANYIKSLKK